MMGCKDVKERYVGCLCPAMPTTFANGKSGLNKGDNDVEDGGGTYVSCEAH